MSARKASGLTAEDLDVLAAGLAAGKRVTVYLREPMMSVGLEAGASARVVGIDGSTVTVRPKGVADELPFEADELHRRRPAASARPALRRKASTTPRDPSAPEAAHSPDSGSVSGTAPSGRPSAGSTPPTVSKPVAAKPDPAESEPVKPGGAKPGGAKPPSRRPKESTVPVSVTVTSAGPSIWTVTVSRGTKKLGKPVEVTADRVARAMQALGDDAAIDVVDGVITAAREAAQRRVAELSAELEDARAALADLDGD